MIACEAQATLDECERLASKSSKREGKHEVVTDLVIVQDLAMAQNQPKSYGGLICEQDEPHAHIRGGRLQETDSVGTQGPRSGREGLLPIPAHMAHDRPHLGGAQPRPSL